MRAITGRRVKFLPVLVPAVVLLPVALLLWAGANVLVRASGLVVSGPTYSVAAVRAGLQRQPAAWAGRTGLLRGDLQNCPLYGLPMLPTSCTGWQPSIGDGADPAALPLWVAGSDPLLTFLRRLPLVRDLIPAPQVLHWDAPATYRVRLNALADTQCGITVCYEAVLLDAQTP